MRRNTYHSTIWVCSDCMFAREGDGNPERPAELPAEWSDVDSRFDVTAGRYRHDDDCPRATDEPASGGPECWCDREDFSTSACDGCGDFHHGERYAYALWVEDPIPV